VSGQRASRLPEADASKLRDTAKIVGWGLAIYGAMAIVNAYMKHNAVGALAVQAVMAEFGAGRLAIAWSDPTGPVPTTSSIARRAGKGAALGALAAGLVVVFAWATHAATFAPTKPTPMMLGVGLLTAGLLSMKDELLLRGVVLRALRNSAPPYVGLLVCGLAGAAASLGSMGDVPAGAAFPWREPLMAGLLAVSFAVLWMQDRGAWLAWGAHAAWVWTNGPILRGGLADLRWAPGSWGGGEMTASTAATVAVAAITLGAVAFHVRRPRKVA